MIKTFLIVLASIVLLLVVAVAGFVYTFDADHYKEEITDIAEAITGRSITIAGDMHISLYPWIGIKIHDVTVENPAGFSHQTFATIGQFDVRIKVIPLLQRQLDIDRLVLHDLEVGFEKNVAGELNWSGFSAASGNDNAGSKIGLAGLTFGAIDITDSSLNWLDADSGKQFRISNMNLATQAISKGQSLPVEIKADVESNQPEWRATINATTKLDFDDDKAVLNAHNLKLAATTLLPDTQMGKISFALVADSVINLQTQSARLTNARLGALGLVMSGVFDIENIFSVPVIQGPMKVKTFEAGALAKHLKLDMPQFSNAQSLKKVSLTTAFKTDFSTVYLDDISASVDQSRVTGFVHIARATQSGVRYELKVDKLDLDNYRLVSKESQQDEIALPLDFIRTANLAGVIDVETASLDDVEFKQLHIETSINNGVVKANPISMQLKEGEVLAALQLDARELPAALFAAKVKQVDADASINPLLKTIMGDEALILEGQVNADANLSARGASVAALKTAAQGTIKLDMDRVVVEGVDFDHASRSVAADYAQRNDFRVSRQFASEYIPNNKTAFSRLSATFKLSNGKLVNNDLLLVSDQVNVTGSGHIDLFNAKLDYRPVIDMKVKNTVNVRDKLRDHPMQYRAHGQLGALTYDFDVERYDLHMGRLMIQEAKANRNRRINSQSSSNWQNVLSK